MFNVGIIGAGWIARKMAMTLQSTPNDCRCYAVASRSLEKAESFASEFGIAKAYGSYEELLSDDDIDLVYIATPHSHHASQALMAIEYGKPCLVEKAFTANVKQAEQVLLTARKHGVFVAEAIWTRYMPLSHKIKELIDAGSIGIPRILTSTLCYQMEQKERIIRSDLCGGALLDLGVYCLNFARMYFGDDIIKTVSNCQLGPSGVDLQECISLSYADGKMANLQAGALCQNDRQGIISGSEGYIRVDNMNCPSAVEVFRDNELVEKYRQPDDMISGYEYQVFECKRCIEQGLIESPMMPHNEILAVMHQMDELRKDWGVVYPMD